jgi:predicted TIM-barrel fold metal-dependent hydrolase
MKPYFELTELDRNFLRDYIRPRLPKKVFDIHVHLNLPEHVASVPEERWLSDWALECGHLLPVDDAFSCVEELFPGVEYSIAGFPWPIKEADIDKNNRYLAQMALERKISPFMAVRPEWDVEKIEKTLIEGRFVGFKPYPDMVSGVKGADISIFDFFPHKQWEILNRNRKAVMLHLPRKERIADKDNIRELREVRQKYPDVKIIIAHFGRSFTPYYLRLGLEGLGDPDDYYFDTTAVINPEVYTVAFGAISWEHIVYGSDLPITLWHGKREWTEREYINLCRENYTWNINRRPPEVESQYTIFLYEEIRAILDAIARHSPGDEVKNGVFRNNALEVLGLMKE